jgi:alpha,alpha-trehalose phosphorylase
MRFAMIGTDDPIRRLPVQGGCSGHYPDVRSGSSVEARRMTSTSSSFDAVLFDLDGVLTATSALHAAAWKQTFDAVLAECELRTGLAQEPFDLGRDYLDHVDGKPRADGVRDFLRSRGIVLPEGDVGSPPEESSVHGVGNRKQALFERALADGGVHAFPGSVRWVERLRADGLRTAVVSSSANSRAVLGSAGIDRLFDAVVDGRDIGELGLRGKPAPDGFLAAAQRLDVAPARAVVVEDALAGVAAGRAGAFGLVIGVARGATPAELLLAGADMVVEDLGELV